MDEPPGRPTQREYAPIGGSAIGKERIGARPVVRLHDCASPRLHEVRFDLPESGVRCVISGSVRPIDDADRLAADLQ